MNSALQHLKVRMMVALDDADAIEIRPIEAVNADLERLGVDPGGCIALARSLSQSTKTPAGRLLDRLEKADEIAAEINALEKAGIDEVRTAVPEGTAAAIAADARRQAGQSSNITSFKRRRFPVLGAGSSLMAIAACLVLFIAVRPDQLDRTEPQAVEEVDAVTGAVSEGLADEAFVEEGLVPEEHVEMQASEQRSFAGRSTTEREQPEADAAFAPDRLEKAVNRETRAAMVDKALKPAPNQPSEEAGQIETATAASPPSEAPPLPKARPVQPTSLARTAERHALPAPGIEREREAIQLPWQTEPVGLPDGIKALLVVEPNQMPTTLDAMSSDLPRRDLEERLPQARAAVGDRTIVALISFERDGETIDAAIVAESAGPELVPTAPMALNSLAEPAPTLANPFYQDFLVIELPELRD